MKIKLCLAIVLAALLVYKLSSSNASITISHDMSTNEIYSEYADGVVQIMAMNTGVRTVMYTGTGFMIRKDGLLVTAAHVISDDSGRPHDRIGIIIGQGNSKDVYKVNVLKIDSAHDMALLKMVRDIEAKCLRVDYGYEPVAGDRVVTIGYPDNFYRLISDGMIANGRPMNIIMGKDDVIYNDVMATTLYLISGNSGGPVFNMHGGVIGIATAGMHNPISIYQKIKYLRRLLSDRSNHVTLSKMRTKDGRL